MHSCKFSMRRFYSKLTFSRNFLVLGIESSCDDTACGIIDGSGKLVSESLYSQGEVHLRYGGVNPLIAQDLHRDKIKCVVDETLKKGDVSIKKVDAIAVTVKPGLLFSLQVGVRYALYLSKKYDKPLIPVHHMEAHALVPRMFNSIPFPFIVLLISGGHCLLALAKDVDEFYLLGHSLDNSPGELLDKAARRMKLRHIPAYAKMAGGKAIESAAKMAIKNNLFNFTVPLQQIKDCNFSFSGYKNTLEKHLLKKETEHNIAANGIIPEVSELCASFQQAITDHLVHRLERGILFCEQNNLVGNVRSIVVSGGVACNNYIFKSIETLGNMYEFKVYRPPIQYCTDNGVMIAWNGFEKVRSQCTITEVNLNSIDPKATFGESYTNKVLSNNIPVKVTQLKYLNS